MSDYDILIRGGRVVDGTGSGAFEGDVGVKDGVIVEIGPKLSGTFREVVEAEGHIVTPGFIDPHTHFDGQATWDDRLDPSFGHGVTTVVMGNCGVGFAPVRPGGQAALIDIMEGVEDIPGTALHEAMPWGEWETYPEYLAFLRSRDYAIDLGSHIAHGALRAYVMGPEDIYGKIASEDQIDAMAAMVKQAMKAGAMGLSTNRAIGHKSVTGDAVPGTYASETELLALMRAMGSTDAGVLQAMPSGGMGALDGVGPDHRLLADEVAMMGRLSRQSGRPITYTLFQLPEAPEAWRDAIALSEQENASGAQLRPQVAPRQPGLLMSLGGYHPLQRRETYLKIRHLPLEGRIREMRKPEIKAAILADRDILDERPGSMENFLCLLMRKVIGRLFPLGSPVNYEPDPSESIAGLAVARGDSEQSVLYDLLLEHDGRNVVMLADTNYVHNSLEAVREMFLSPTTVSGLSDAGAHVRFICDASISTYTLTHFVRDRTRGPKIPIEAVVAKLSANTADLYAMADRGRLLWGKRADINVIDLDHLKLNLPVMHHDLPNGSPRLLQATHGYRMTMVNGVITRAHDQDTGQRPGRLLSGRAGVG